MKFHLETAEIYVPDGASVETALARTTHLCIGAHQDDLEIMAAGPILECYQQKDRWFSGVVVTDGRGSPRAGVYQSFSDDEMHLVRFREQRSAASLGEYSALVMLDYPSRVVKDASRQEPVEDLVRLLRAARPRRVYTHNLADKHDTHVAVALRVIAALRRLDPAERPGQVLGCEVWRSLDWLVDPDKALMDVSTRENLQLALLGVFDSQIAGGKRYDLAAMGRRRANATFFEAHEVDSASALAYALDLTPLMDAEISPTRYVREFIDRFAEDVKERIEKLFG